MAKSESETSEPSSSRPWESYHTVFTNAKAGMEGVDKEKVQRIVYEMSKGSKYFENEEKKEAYTKQKIENMRVQYSKLTAQDISHHQKMADKRILELEATRDLSRIWLHVDMDAFYAAVETLCNPSLEGKPLAVGSMSMISTASYEARKFGVRAAMPGFIARKLCPELLFVPVDFQKYNHYSNLTRKVFQKYDPNFLAASLDEAYLDITSVCKERGITSGEVAEELRQSVHLETGLTCSAGVAPNRLLAKVCSDINKPNGQFVLPNDRSAILTFISSLPIRKIGGIGKVTERILKDVFGIATCEEMLQKSSFICALFSRSSADFFLSVGLGLGGTDTPQYKTRKSISNERTFSATEDEALLFQKLVDLSEMLSADMKREGLFGRTLTLKLKTASFEVRTRAVTLPSYISSSEEILKHGSKLLKAEFPVSLRLMGLRMSHFSEDKNGIPPDPTQKTLSNFILAGDASGGKTSDYRHLVSDVCDNTFSVDVNCCPTYCAEPSCDLCDLSMENQTSDSTYSCHILRNINEEVNETVVPPNSEPRLKVHEPADTDHTIKSEKVVSYTGQFEASSCDRWEIGVNCADDEAGSVSDQKQLFRWVDDYKCSICGIELPPSFVEERQEHSDFHLAEKLQGEESGNHHRSFMPQQRKAILEAAVGRKRNRNHLQLLANTYPLTRSLSKQTRIFERHKRVKSYLFRRKMINLFLFSCILCAI
ncbi:DNA polymerase kappa-like isoform X1 [Lycium barbarum]|uniref:DNA polymerase kappa-like isoform X1 n=1 Tax=Lycium barbarum TaxID=112863 RepID=UPI00293E8B61|nr:DNA polymerase kappa-like isoform X1 [Lycium barbarum]